MSTFIAIFDADAVLLRSTRPADFREQRYGLTRGKLRPFYEANACCMEGRGDTKEVLIHFLEEWGIPDSVDDFMQEFFYEGIEIDSEVAEVIASLRARGIMCCLGTNQEKHRMAYLDEHLKLREYFDRSFVSCEVGARKPEHDYYHSVQAHFPSEQLVFWDDRADNVGAARECGWTAYVYKEIAQMRSEVAQLLS